MARRTKPEPAASRPRAMDDATRKGTLPAPFQSIRYNFHIRHGAAWLEFLGPLEDIERAHLINTEMKAVMFKRHTGKRKHDGNGIRYYCHRKATEAQPTRILLKFHTRKAEAALALPGVRDEFPAGFLLDKDEGYTDPRRESVACVKNEPVNGYDIYRLEFAQGYLRSAASAVTMRIAELEDNYGFVIDGTTRDHIQRCADRFSRELEQAILSMAHERGHKKANGPLRLVWSNPAIV